MNIGKKINALRKSKNVTQDELAAELGVTAAAVSKWENGYTLPDILMLCALADYFQVTTDELLGRTEAQKQAIVVAQTEELGQKIADLLARYHIKTSVILTDYEAALESAKSAAESGGNIHYMFTATDYPLEEREYDHTYGVVHVNVQVTNGVDDTVLDGIELYLKNIDAFKNITDMTANMKKSCDKP